MRILFITRKYPPSIGGMETVSVGLTSLLGKDGIVLALRKRSQLHLIWWIPFVALRALWLARQVEVIHLGDGLLAGLGVWLHWLTRKPVTVTVHGLDLTFNKAGYQAYIHWALPKLQAVIAVSMATGRLVESEFKLAALVIHNGVTVEDFPFNQALGENRCLLFVGRMVERKGCAWFIEYVLPQLPDVHLHVVGNGQQLERCQQLVGKLNLTEQVRFHGQVTAHDLHDHYTHAQALIMPNLIIAGDMEGFGMVALEAGACGLPVLAANLEGMRSAIIDGSTGFLVESGDVTAWIQAVQRILSTPLQAEVIRRQVDERFSWQQAGTAYRKVWQQTIEHNN